MSVQSSIPGKESEPFDIHWFLYIIASGDSKEFVFVRTRQPLKKNSISLKAIWLYPATCHRGTFDNLTFLRCRMTDC